MSSDEQAAHVEELKQQLATLQVKLQVLRDKYNQLELDLI